MSLSSLLPPPGVSRSLTVQSSIYAIGSGLFTAGSVFFFTRVVGLSARQVGVGLSIAGLTSLAASMPMGVLADRVGHRRTWLLTVLVQSAIFACYPLVRGFRAFLAVIVVLAIVESASANGRGAYTISILPAEIRVRSQAFQRSALNLGFTFGGLLAGIALAVDTRPAYYALVLGYAGLLLVSAVFITRLPEPTPELPPEQASEQPPASETAPTAKERVQPFLVLRDRPVLTVSAVVALLGISDTIILTVLPLWMIKHTDSPNAVYAWLIALNCVLVALLQVRASRGAHTVPGATRALRISGIAGAAGAVVLATTVESSGWFTIGLLVAAMVFLTGCELFQSAGFWGIVAELSPPARRAEYQAAFYLGNQAERTIGPACFTALTITLGVLGWALLGGVFLAAVLCIAPAVRWTQRTPRLGPAGRLQEIQ